MDDFPPFDLQNKKVLISLAIFLLLLISIPLAAYLAQKTQIFAPKAVGDYQTIKANLVLGGNLKGKAALQGEVLIKLKASLPPLRIKSGIRAEAANLDAQGAKLSDLDQNSLPSSLKSINTRYPIQKVEKVFKGEQGPSQPSQRASQGRRIDIQKLSSVDLSKVYKLSFAKNTNISSLLQDLISSSQLDYAVPNYLLRASMTTNDPYYLDSYPTQVSNRVPNWNPKFDYQWDLKKIQVDKAWDNSLGADNLLTAVVDTGVDYTHPKLGGCTLSQVNSGGCPKVAPGFSFVTCDEFDIFTGFCVKTRPQNNNPLDDHGHGTHVSGTILSINNNNLGTSAINWRGKILPVKVLNKQGYGDLAEILEGLDWAIQNGASVINMSFGGVDALSIGNPVTPYDDVFNLADSFGVVLVAASGNSNDNISNGYYPANHPKVIAVGATDNLDRKASFSNYGYKLSVSAPGTNIISLRSAGTDMYLGAAGYPAGQNVIGDKFYLASGTSMASPHVAALAALILSKNPSLGADQVRSIIESSADLLGNGGFDPLFGFGRINAQKALLTVAAPPPIAQITSPINSQVISGNVQIRGTATGVNFASFNMTVGVGKSPTSWSPQGITLTNGGNSPIQNSVLATFDQGQYQNSNVVLRLEVIGKDGVKKQAFVSAVTSNPISLSPLTQVNQSSSLNAFYPSSDIDQNGNVYVTWVSYNTGQTSKIFLNISQDQGKGFGGDILISDPQLDPVVYRSVVKTLKSSVLLAYDSTVSNHTKLVIKKSTDGAKTFSITKVIDDPTMFSNSDGPFNTHMAVDKGRDYAYLTWQGGKTEDASDYSRIYFARFNNTTDQVDLFKSVAKPQSPYHNTNPSITVDNDGSVYIAWVESPPDSFQRTHWIKSTDSGNSFSDQKVLNLAFSEMEHQNRPELSFDPVSGNLYLVTTGPDLRFYTVQTWISKSSDKGGSFTNPVSLTPSGGGWGVYRASPAVADSKGNIYVIYGSLDDSSTRMVRGDQSLQNFTSPAFLLPATGFINTFSEKNDLVVLPDQNVLGFFGYFLNGDFGKPSQIMSRGTNYQVVVTISPTPSLAQISQTLVLDKGSTSVGLLIDRGPNYKAEDLLKEVNQSVQVRSVRYFNPASQNYVIHLYQQSADNFNIVPGMGYFLTGEAGTVRLIGTQAAVSNFNIARSYSFISFPILPANIKTAEDLLQAMQKQGIDVRDINRWDGSKFVPHKLGDNTTNFQIKAGEGYFMRNYGVPKIFTLTP